MGDACSARCEAKCGVPDGCGGVCGCPLGARCGEAGSCEPDPCAACSADERCVEGACVCAPQCDDKPCSDDGCGGKCACPAGAVQNAAGEWVSREQCHDTCVGSGWMCGELCGYECGKCSSGTACADGWCACEPLCDGTRCDDGCGGTCACTGEDVCDAQGFCVKPARCPETCQSTKAACGEVCGESCGGCDEGQSCSEGRCRAAISCADCPLQLRVLERNISAGRITSLRIALDFVPAGMPLPRLADLRLKANRPLTLLAAKLGEALVTGGKVLAHDEATGQPWIEQRDGSFQFLVLQSTNVTDIGAGRLLELSFASNEPGPIELSLARREQTLAPPESDAALQASGYDAPLLVTR